MFYVALAIGCLGLISAAWALIKLNALRTRLDAAMGGNQEGSVESSLAATMDRMRQVDEKLDTLAGEYKKLSVVSSLASQKISIVRFNPFGDTGGDQSFSLAVLDAYNSGYTVTSIHGRQGTRVYIKPVDYGKSKYALSKEEKQAIDQAIKRVPNFESAK